MKPNNGRKRIVVRAASDGGRVIAKVFSDLAKATAHEAGRPWVFVLAGGTVIVWALTGPIFNFSDTWQLVINTGTSVMTFLMVFLIQNSQNRDSAAIQVKLDELIRVSEAHNSFVGLERLTDEELRTISEKCGVRAKLELNGVRETKAARSSLKLSPPKATVDHPGTPQPPRYSRSILRGDPHATPTDRTAQGRQALRPSRQER